MIGIGSTVGNYQVVKKLGSGAMGVVFLAEHPTIGKRVALKVIHSDLAENQEMLSRFFTEAKAVTRIGHDNIIEFIDFGQTPEGDSFIVMELLEGQSLYDRLKADKVVSVDVTLTIAVQIAEGLEASHKLGIVHRDLKPDNVYLIARPEQPNFVKILDFGLAKLTQGGENSYKTRAGAVLGTAHYMAPEQCEGKPDIDHRVDIYALGCILHEMLCGQVPYPGEAYMEVLIKHLGEPLKKPSLLCPSMPRSVEMIIERALAKPRAERFQSMREMADAMRDPDKWAREFTGEAPLRTSERAAPAPPPPARQMAPLPMQISGPYGGGDAARTIVGRQAPPPASAAPRTSQPSTATAVMEAPRTQSNARPAYYSTTDQHRRAPAPRALGNRLVIIGGVAVAAIVLGLVAVWILERPRPAIQTPAPSELAVTVQSIPSGAEVLRDGRAVGVTPFILRVPAETKTLSLTFRKAGFLEDQRLLDPTAQPQLTVTMRAALEEARPTSPENPKNGGEPTRSPKVHKAAGHSSTQHKPPQQQHNDQILAPKF